MKKILLYIITAAAACSLFSAEPTKAPATPAPAPLGKGQQLAPVVSESFVMPNGLPLERYREAEKFIREAYKAPELQDAVKRLNEALAALEKRVVDLAAQRAPDRRDDVQKVVDYRRHLREQTAGNATVTNAQEPKAKK
ncbi:hypothetical protein [Oleiharenicola sp. Vm1]|uniref:hypothetical protein n=1 Tax=Oleiharenicola sp. Vm1 TaxID=3398393 RepID=UPI0039F55792